MKLIAALMMGMVGWCGAQTAKPTVSVPKCGKYQTLQIHGYTINDAPRCPKEQNCVLNFDFRPKSAECTDNMHPVTERDWQELQQRLKTLEQHQGDFAEFIRGMIEGRSEIRSKP